MEQITSSQVEDETKLKFLGQKLNYKLYSTNTINKNNYRDKFHLHEILILKYLLIICQLILIAILRGRSRYTILFPFYKNI